jgi:hypothetical protein
MNRPLPDSLVRFGDQLERAVERDRLAARRRPRRLALRATTATAAAVAIAAGVVSLPLGDGTVAPPGVATASAAERAVAVLSPGPGSIVHTVATYRATAAGGGVSTWREETWRQTARPYAVRELVTRDGARIETGTVGDRGAELYDPASNTIYVNPPDGGPALGTPEPAADGDPLAEQMADLLRSGRARAVSRAGATIRFAYDDPLPGGGSVKWTYVVDATSYRPIRLTTASLDGSRVAVRFGTYEALDASPRADALPSLRAQHPGAAVARTQAGYAAAQARLSAGGGVR